MDFKNTKLSLERPVSDYAKVQAWYSKFVRGRKSQLRRALTKAETYLNIGCGPNIAPGFLNLDYEWRPGIDLCWDITRGLPLEDQSLQGIFTEHCLEHIPLAECRRVLSECCRVLKPNGVLRIIVPDGGLYLELYHQSRQGLEVAFPYQTPTEQSAMMCVNRVFREHGHLFAYDQVTLELLLRQAGFQHSERVSFRIGRDQKLLIDSESRAVESLYIEAFAPAHV